MRRSSLPFVFLLPIPAILALLAWASSPLHADATVVVASKSGGFQGMGASEGTTTRFLQGNKAREDAQFKFTGGMMKMAGAKDGSHILRVDLDKRWQLNHKKKTYTEYPIVMKFEEKSESGKAEKPSGSEAEEEKPTHRVKKTEFTIKKTGEKKAVNGFSTEETQALMSVEIEEIATGEVTGFSMDTRLWLTPLTADLKKALDEEAKFQKAYMAKMGLTLSPKDKDMFGGQGLAMMLGLGDKKTSDLIASFKEKTKDVKGYPIVTTSEWNVKEDPKAITRRDEAKKAAASEDEEIDYSGGAQDVAGSFLKGFAKKKVRENQDKKEKAREGEPVFSTYHEVKSVSVGSLSDDQFEVPKGYKKVQ